MRRFAAVVTPVGRRHRQNAASGFHVPIEIPQEKAAARRPFLFHHQLSSSYRRPRSGLEGRLQRILDETERYPSKPQRRIVAALPSTTEPRNLNGASIYILRCA